ncbi:unnamed protein product, partial [Clonostachys chloroleuca]
AGYHAIHGPFYGLGRPHYPSHGTARDSQSLLALSKWSPNLAQGSRWKSSEKTRGVLTGYPIVYVPRSLRALGWRTSCAVYGPKPRDGVYYPQTGVFGMTRWTQTWHRWKKDQRMISTCIAIGTIVLVLGMMVCSHVVESKTIQKKYTTRNGLKATMAWLQQGKTVNDQSFDSYAVIFTKGENTIVTSERSTSERERSDGLGLNTT